MHVIALDSYLLVAGLAFLLWGRLFRPNYKFQADCQMVSTIWAQYSMGLSWSLAKLAPFFASTNLKGGRCRTIKWFLPFASYVAVSTGIGFYFWDIPPGVSFWYGGGRALVQLAIFASLTLSAVALSRALRSRIGQEYFRKALTIMVVVHGIASVYEFVAGRYGLPIIGISRAHEHVVDVASFSAGSATITRPGGLAGEPKTAAILYGIFLLTAIFSPIPKPRAKTAVALHWVAVVLASVGFLAAFSTSAFVGSVLAVGILWARFRVGRLGRGAKLALVLLLAVLGWALIIPESAGLPSLRKLVLERTVYRIEDQGGLSDPPVRASISAMEDNPRIAVFGAGLGGSSFLIMKYLGWSDASSYAPNIGAIFLLVETGIVGVLLLVVPWGLLMLKRAPPDSPGRDLDAGGRFLISLSVGAMLLDLTGSGIAMGFPLAVGAIAAYSNEVRLSTLAIAMPGQKVPRRTVQGFSSPV